MASAAASALVLALPPLAVAFSPPSPAAADARCVGASSASTSISTKTIAWYRNYDDTFFYDVDGQRIAKNKNKNNKADGVVAKKSSAAAQTASSRAAANADRNNRNVIIANGGDYVGGFHMYDVDGDRTSLRSLLDPPAPPLVVALPEIIKSTTATTTTTMPLLQTPEERQASLRAAAKKAASSTATGAQQQRRRQPQRPASPIVSLYTVQDYRAHVLHPPNAEGELLCIVRFKAPWCQTCRTTNVAWERMAAKLSKLSASSPKNKVKFLSVELDGREGTSELRDMLGIEGVPQGVLHHPAQGIVQQRVKMHRSNLSALKRNLERYCTYTRGEDELQSGMLLDGLKE